MQATAVMTKNELRVLQALSDESRSAEELGLALGIKQSEVLNALRGLNDEGAIHRPWPTGDGTRWRISDYGTFILKEAGNLKPQPSGSPAALVMLVVPLDCIDPNEPLSLSEKQEVAARALAELVRSGQIDAALAKQHGSAVYIDCAVRDAG
jgi:hypothetical protein